MEDHFKNIWYLENKDERIKLIENLEQSILTKRSSLSMNPNSDLLYKEARFCFINGCYISSALTFYLAIEQYLLWRNQINKGLSIVRIIHWPSSFKIFKEALGFNLINQEMKEKLELYNQGCRDQILHLKKFYHLHDVGLPKDSKTSTTFGREEMPLVYVGPLGCAKRALDLFFEILEYST